MNGGLGVWQITIWAPIDPVSGRPLRLLADPTGTLPWHPMVLHRGGWPDAS